MELSVSANYAANQIPQLLLSRRSFNNPENGVRDFLSIAGRRGKCCVELCRDLLDGTIRIGAGVVGSRYCIAENRSLISTGFDNHGFNSLPGKFVVVRLGQRLERKFGGAIETHGRSNDASSGAADVHEHAAALAPHMRKHGAIHANRAKKIRIHEMLGLFGGDSLCQPREEIAGVVDGDVDATGFGDGGLHSPFDRGVVGHIQLKDGYWKWI